MTIDQYKRNITITTKFERQKRRKRKLEKLLIESFHNDKRKL